MGWIEVLVRKTCTLIAVICVAACFAQAASALDLNTMTPPPMKPQQKPDWAGFYFRNNSSGSDPWTVLAPSTGFTAPTTTTQPSSENFGYNFQSGNFVFGLEGSFAAANFDGKFTAPYLPATRRRLDAEYELARHGHGPGGLFVWSMAALCQGRLRGRRRRLAAARRGPIGSFTQSTAITGWTAGVGFEYQFSSKWSLGLEYLYTDFGTGAPNGTPGSIGGLPFPARRRCIAPR